MLRRIAYMPLNTYPEAPSDAATLAAIRMAEALGCGVHVSTFAVDIPPAAMPGGSLVSVEGMARTVEDRSTKECERLRALVDGAGLGVEVMSHRAVMGAAPAAAAAEARYFDLALLPWSAGTVVGLDLAQALVFGSGRPVILVPASTAAAPLDHLAVAWDESRVAARALGDALALLSPGGRVSVLTVGDEKALEGSQLSQALAAALGRRGYDARAVDVSLGGRTIAAALQEGARAEGAQLLAMGGFGHSRLRDFILGGATRDVLADLSLPVLLSH